MPTVLIVEDDCVVRDLLVQAVEAWDYEARSATNGDEAWALLQQLESPRIVILDWELPGMDGLEIARRLTAAPGREQTWVIMTTGRDSSSVAEAFDAGADDFLTKPFDLAELKARLAVGGRVVKLQSSLSNQVRELREALSHVQTLSELVPICMHCHRIRQNTPDAAPEMWERLESFIERQTGSRVSHGLCPQCLEEHYPDPDLDLDLDLDVDTN